MIAARKNLVLDQGATFVLTLRYKDSAGVPIDLAGWSGKFIVKKRNTGTLVKEVAADLSPVGTAVGYVTINIPDEETALMSSGDFAYNIDLTDASGDVTRIIFGRLEVRSGFHV